MLKFADTPNQRQGRIKRQRQTRKESHCHPPLPQKENENGNELNLNLNLNPQPSVLFPDKLSTITKPTTQDRSAISYNLQLLDSVPPLIVPTKPRQAIVKSRTNNLGYWLDFSTLSSSNENRTNQTLFGEIHYLKEDIVRSFVFQECGVSGTVVIYIITNE